MCIRDSLWEGEDKQKTIAALIAPYQNNKSGEILVISDSDFLADSLYSDENSQIADNKNFILNSIDYLSGDQGLMKLRSKQKIKRNFTKIDDLKNAAQTQILEKQGVLNQELQTINQQIRELSSQAVSYTHLDVYKRQPFLCVNLKAISKIQLVRFIFHFMFFLAF